MHNPFDHIAKNVGKEALAASGPTIVQYEISRDAQHADLRHDPAQNEPRSGSLTLNEVLGDNRSEERGKAPRKAPRRRRQTG